MASHFTVKLKTSAITIDVKDHIVSKVKKGAFDLERIVIAAIPPTVSGCYLVIMRIYFVRMEFEGSGVTSQHHSLVSTETTPMLHAHEDAV